MRIQNIYLNILTLFFCVVVASSSFARDRTIDLNQSNKETDFPRAITINPECQQAVAKKISFYAEQATVSTEKKQTLRIQISDLRDELSEYNCHSKKTRKCTELEYKLQKLEAELEIVSDNLQMQQQELQKAHELQQNCIK